VREGSSHRNQEEIARHADRLSAAPSDDRQCEAVAGRTDDAFRMHFSNRVASADIARRGRNAELFGE
jgi:predicted dienelactone hydrolase